MLRNPKEWRQESKIHRKTKGTEKERRHGFWMLFTSKKA
jgi:hypothetical protein